MLRELRLRGVEWKVGAADGQVLPFVGTAKSSDE